MFDGWNELLLERVVSHGFCDPELAQSAWTELQERHERGDSIHLGQVLIRLRAISPTELALVLREMKDVAFHCPTCGASYEIRRYRIGKAYPCRRCGEALEVRGREPLPPETVVGVAKPLDRRTPSILGPYEIEGEVGRGGMGTVYRGRHRVLGHVVAIKTLERSEVRPKLLERFRREAAAIARIAHPNIVRFLEWGEEGSHTFYAMELVEGITLEARLEVDPLPEREALRILERVARALHAAHEIGVLHRDLKPGNILLRPDGEPVLLDFGLARFVSEEIESLTGTGIALGTPYYMSPEQALGEKGSIGRWSDVYSMGVILYEALSGVKPFTAASAVELLYEIQTSSPLPLRSRAPEIRPAVEAACMRAMARDPEERFQTAEALASALAGLQRS